ncbi:2-oxo-tetronate isomerase [Salinisphaera sp. SPP-AMP-43]|uniref:2-oxo-tetronate isomerase n=1 Tax=Salinisphaera sp. SPP-AMP-43 TaxID=3121288 RepID=UPI003C6DCF15
MLNFAANLSLLFRELGFMDRFAAARRAGFAGVECLFPYAWEANELARTLQHNALHQVLFNAPPGDWAAGERGLAGLPGREPEFRAGIEQALVYAECLGCPRVHVMAGNVAPGAECGAIQDTLLENLRYAAHRFAAYGLTLLVEPLNTRDMPGYFLTQQSQAHALVASLAEPNVAVQMDFYHAQIMGGDVWTTFRAHQARIGHIQIAGVPDRHEPDTGELNYPWLFRQFEAAGYDGWIGCEYLPQAGTEQGLAWWDRLRAGERR